MFKLSIVLFIFTASCTSLDESYPEYLDSSVDESVSVPHPGIVFPIEEKSLCETSCISNEDCDEFGGVCLWVNDSYKLRTICTKSCSSVESCEKGFSCIILIISNKFNFQCIPTESPICIGG